MKEPRVRKSEKGREKGVLIVRETELCVSLNLLLAHVIASPYMRAPSCAPTRVVIPPQCVLRVSDPTDQYPTIPLPFSPAHESPSHQLTHGL